ncbi:MAG: hypothetical protein AAFZ92_04780 [Pseudomonadota bacterium]
MNKNWLEQYLVEVQQKPQILGLNNLVADHEGAFYMENTPGVTFYRFFWPYFSFFLFKTKT